MQELFQRFLEENIGKTMRSYYLHLPLIFLLILEADETITFI